MFKQLRDESTQPVGTFCEEKLRTDKSTREPAQTQMCQGERPESHTGNAFRETGMHKIMCYFA